VKSQENVFVSLQTVRKRL